MKHTHYTRDVDVLVKKLINEKILRHTCQFFTKEGKEMKPLGTGVLALVHDIHYIITASHVAEVIGSDKDVYIQIDHQKYINIFGDIKMTDLEKDKNIDLAYIKLADELIAPLKKSYIFLTIDKFRKHVNLLDASNYCILGFPENNIRYENGKMRTGAAYYITTPAKDNRYKYYNFAKEDCYVLDIAGKGTNLFSGEKSKINTHFHGMSGCGLWLVIIEQDPETSLFSIDYRLIGIMTEYKKGKYFCLIGNRIHLIIEAWKAIENHEFKEILLPETLKKQINLASK